MRHVDTVGGQILSDQRLKMALKKSLEAMYLMTWIDHCYMERKISPLIQRVIRQPLSWFLFSEIWRLSKRIAIAIALW